MRKIKKEHWNKRQWVIVILLCLIFPPIGIAAIIRRQIGKVVWQ